jgi:hypothetical protein
MQPEGAAQIDYPGTCLKQARRQFHGYFGWRRQEDEFNRGRPDRFGLARQVFGFIGFTQGGLMGGMFAVIQQQSLDVRVMLQNPNEFRPAIAPVADDGDLAFQMCIYSSL